jgi:hypothetical protein
MGINIDLGNISGSKGLGMAKRTQKWTQENIRLGNSLDMQNQKEMFDYRIDAGLEAGMTPYEMFMGPAAGAGGGTTGSGAVLGNSAQQLGKQMMQNKQQQQMVKTQIVADLAKTKMQTDSQKEVAEIQAGASRYGTDVKAATDAARLALDKETYVNTIAPKAAAELGLTVQQTLKAVNEVATSEPKFLKMMKVATMSSENILATLTALGLPFDVLNPEDARKLTPKQREEVTRQILGILSHTRKEAEGLKAIFQDAVERLREPPGMSPVMGNGDSRIDGANKIQRHMINQGG